MLLKAKKIYVPIIISEKGGKESLALKKFILCICYQRRREGKELSHLQRTLKSFYSVYLDLSSILQQTK